MILRFILTLGLLIGSVAAAIYFFKNKKTKVGVFILPIILIIAIRLIYLGFTLSYFQEQQERQTRRNTFTIVEENKEAGMDFTEGDKPSEDESFQSIFKLPETKVDTDENQLRHGLDAVLERTETGEIRARHDYSKITDKLVKDFLYGEAPTWNFFESIKETFSAKPEEERENQQKEAYRETLKESIANSLRKNSRKSQ